MILSSVFGGLCDPKVDRWQAFCIHCFADGCQRCGGRGYREKRVAPLDLLTEPGTALFNAYRWLKNYNILPISAGLSNQSAKFVKMVEFCDIVVARMSKMKDNIREGEAKQAEMLSKMMRGKRGRQ